MNYPRRRPRATYITMGAALLAELRPRFEANTRREGKHLLWTGELHRGTWPRIAVDGRAWGAAAVAWLLSGKPLMLGARLWRTCTRQRCISCRSTQAPPWSPKRRAAERERSIAPSSAASQPAMRWAAAARE